MVCICKAIEDKLCTDGEKRVLVKRVHFSAKVADCCTANSLNEFNVIFFFDIADDLKESNEVDKGAMLKKVADSTWRKFFSKSKSLSLLGANKEVATKKRFLSLKIESASWNL